MRNKIWLVAGVLVFDIGIVLLCAVLLVRLNGYKQIGEYATLEEMAYDQSGQKTMVYIKENDEYIPYLVLESDYGGGGNVLLLRENLLPERMQYQPSPHGEAIGALSAPWTTYDYGSYYETSSIDKYLDTDFLKVFSPAVQEVIATTSIEVTDKESYHEDKWAEATHIIERKVFMLSAVELGITYSVGYCITKEGTPLQYFENAQPSVKKAYTANGDAWSYWTRTPWIWETCNVVVIGDQLDFGIPTADSKSGVRPAFCMGKDTTVQKSDSVIEGKRVYVLELDGE